jgi:hydrogenase expression/formation protein HypE
MYITTAGVALCSSALPGAAPGDAVIISGGLGRHHACILSARMGVKNKITSDVAPLTDMVGKLTAAGVPLHALRDITRGGLATVLGELAATAGICAEINESAVPASEEVRGLCKILGLDPFYMGSEGLMLVVVPAAAATAALGTIKNSRYGEDAAVIGYFTDGRGVTLCTKAGGRRKMPPLTGEGLPRIC